jgi:glycosyltransferase involved in cell wall biosynthesis
VKILIFAPNYLPATRYGGPIASSHGLAKALVGLGHEVHVFTTNVDGDGVLDVPVGEVVLLDSVKVRYFPLCWPQRLYYSPDMGQVIEQEIASFDVAHINGVYLWPGPKLAKAAERVGVPVIISPRGMLVQELITRKSTWAKRVWISLRERPLLRKAAFIHVTSEVERLDLETLGLNLAPVTLIANGVGAPDVLPAEKSIQDVWEHIPIGRRVVFLGRINWKKGLDLAIDAVLAHPDAQLLIAGPDQMGLRSQLEPLLTRPDGRTAGRFLGSVQGAHKWALLAGADVMLAPSINENFGNSVAEALSVGTSVICTPGVGAASIVARTDPGCVVERTPQALAEALAELLSNPERRRLAGERGRDIMASEYTWRAIAERMVEVYSAAKSTSMRQARLPV